jgi:hypothetical protein
MRFNALRCIGAEITDGLSWLNEVRKRDPI